MSTFRKPEVLRLALVGIAGIGGVFLSSAHATLLDVVLNDTNAADNFLYNNGPTSNFANSGIFYYDNRQVQLDKARPIIRFDLPTLPAGSTITNVQLRITTQQYTYIDVNNGNAVVPHPFGVYRMLQDWSETTSNWNERSAGNPWTTAGMGAGTDYSATATDTIICNSPTTGGVQLFWNITSTYLDWVNSVVPNFGLHIHGPAGDPTRDTNGGDTTDGVFRCYNTEFGDDARRPHLLIDYIPAPGTAPGLLAAALVLGRRRRS